MSLARHQLSNLARVKIDVQQLDSAVPIVSKFTDVVASRGECKPLVGGSAVANVSDMGSVECDRGRIGDLAAVIFEGDVCWFDCDHVHDERIIDQLGGVK